MSAPHEESQASLRARYQSPSTIKEITHPIKAPIPDEPVKQNPQYTKAKTTYLSELRLTAKVLQDEINIFLTHKMSEDKAAADAADSETTKEAGEEEMYGEENVEEA